MNEEMLPHISVILKKPLDMNKFMSIAEILKLTEDEQYIMFDLEGERKNT